MGDGGKPVWMFMPKTEDRRIGAILRSAVFFCFLG
jgi:hypothetical protein